MMRVAILAALPLAMGQAPGNGISKTTYACNDVRPGLAFMLKYLPATASMDSCAANFCGEGERQVSTQGRCQLIESGDFTEANCDLYSSLGRTSSSSSSTSMVSDWPSDCTYSYSSAYSSSSSDFMYSTFAHDADTCCKACATTAGCAGATYSDSSSRRGLKQPQQGEGFGLHLVNVNGSSTSGGLPLDELEDKFTTRLGDMSSFDAFMDYSVQLFSANLPAYASKFAADDVPTFKASWTADSGDTWYSIFVRVPESQMIIELVGTESPSTGNLTGADLATLEARASSKQIEIFADYEADDLNMLYAVSVSRATSNISSIDDFYQNVIQAEVTQTIDEKDVSRRCYAWTGADADVCFAERPAGSSSFEVIDFENMIWAVHAENIASSSNDDKYNDNHYAVDLMQGNFDYLPEYFEANDPFPLHSDPNSWYAYVCMQDYIIDPTGWSIQSDMRFSTSYPGCSHYTQPLAGFKAGATPEEELAAVI